ncbi:MAG: hypothetical protein GY705_26495 [Bacteroidetes bacterium]|nr:hypothetical protein [Bacteroidota bacterium]
MAEDSENNQETSQEVEDSSNATENKDLQNQSGKKDLSKAAVEHDDDEDTDDDASSNAPIENDPVSNNTRNVKKKQACESQTQV